MDELGLIIRQQEQLLHHQHALAHKVDAVLVLLTIVVRQEDDVMQELDDLTAEVNRNTDVQASAVLLIQGLAAKIDANATDPAALRALSAQLKTQADALAAAVAANTAAE